MPLPSTMPQLFSLRTETETNATAPRVVADAAALWEMDLPLACFAREASISATHQPMAFEVLRKLRNPLHARRESVTLLRRDFEHGTLHVSLLRRERRAATVKGVTWCHGTTESDYLLLFGPDAIAAVCLRLLLRLFRA